MGGRWPDTFTTAALVSHEVVRRDGALVLRPVVTAQQPAALVMPSRLTAAGEFVCPGRTDGLEVDGRLFLAGKDVQLNFPYASGSYLLCARGPKKECVFVK